MQNKMPCHISDGPQYDDEETGELNEVLVEITRALAEDNLRDFYGEMDSDSD